MTTFKQKVKRDPIGLAVTMRDMPNPTRNADWLEAVGGRLAATREALGLRQEELALQVGVSRSALANWETGRSLPDVAAIARFAERHRITLDWIYRGDPSALPQSLAQKVLGESTPSKATIARAAT